jgi:tRNA A-37 threonylcarbamoyl transferase component Bud32
MYEDGHIPLRSRWRLFALQIFTLFLVNLATLGWARKLFAYPGGTITCLGFCIKSGETVTLTEAHALQFVAKHTSIPVPAVHHAFVHRGKTYILMERVHGEIMAKRWHLLPSTSKESILSQLKGMIEELRSIPSKGAAICNIDGGPLHDYRLPHKLSWGPFTTISDFHLALRNNVTSEALKGQASSSLSPNAVSDMHKLISFHESVTQPPVLTHGDLNTPNILLDGDKVVAILDWGTAAWMPYYWEYTMTRHANPQNVIWQREVEQFLCPYNTEFEMEGLRCMYFGG